MARMRDFSQSPRRRGSSLLAARPAAWQRWRHPKVSVPSSSGLSLLADAWEPGSCTGLPQVSGPLVVGALVARGRTPAAVRGAQRFQSPRRRGSRCSQRVVPRHDRHQHRFQSPRRRGSRCSVVEAQDVLRDLAARFQSPRRRGSRCSLRWTREARATASTGFQSPRRRGSRCSALPAQRLRRSKLPVSSPLVVGALVARGRDVFDD